jgi:hypothetical protein
MFVTDPIAAIPLLASLSGPDLDQMIAGLSQSDDAELLVRAHALGTRFERDHDPVTLAAALGDYASSRYVGEQRGVVGRALVLRQLQAALMGQPLDGPAIRAMIDEAGDDSAVPDTPGVLHVMVDAVSAYADDPAYDRAEAVQRLERLAATVPAESGVGRAAAFSIGWCPPTPRVCGHSPTGAGSCTSSGRHWLSTPPHRPGRRHRWSGSWCPRAGRGCGLTRRTRTGRSRTGSTSSCPYA